MFSRNTEGFSWGPFLLGILYIIVAVITFNNPFASVLALVYLFAIGIILKGIFEIFLRNRLNEYSTYNHTGLIIIGVIDIIIGLLLFFNIEIGVLTLPVLFALWMIFASISTLITAGPLRNYSNAVFWVVVVLAILSALIGGLLLFNPGISMGVILMLIGIFFLFSGITYIIMSF